ncbi:MAG: CHASE2 domain-containing protein [Candidatus Omnitrophica bacterium]|nr:CHASE2 domain-containing protein [Candidatus Omnitrophota bacterium]
MLVAAVVLAVMCLIQAVGWRFPDYNLLRQLQWMIYDWRVRLAAEYPLPCATNLAAVFIDEDTVDLLKQGIRDETFGTDVLLRADWPFPRSLHGRVLRELAAQGAKEIGFDILFDKKKGGDTPVQVLREDALHSGFAPAELDAYTCFTNRVRHPGKGPKDPPVVEDLPIVLVESDDFFAAQMRQAGNVVLAAETEEEVIPDPLFSTNAAQVGHIFADKDRDGKLRRLYAFRDYRIWSPELRGALEDEGYKPALAVVQKDRIVFPKKPGTNFVLRLDANGFYDPNDLPLHQQVRPGQKRQKPFAVQRFWQMGIVLAARALDFDLAKSIVDLPRHRIVLQGRGGIKRIIPVDQDGRFLIDWSLDWSDPRMFQMSYGTVLAMDMLRHGPQPELHDQLLEGLRKEGITWTGASPFTNKLVVIGSKMVGSNLSDRGPTPLSKQTFFMSTHWNVANSVILGRFVRPYSYLAELAMILMLGGVAAWTTWRWRALWASALVLLLAGLTTAAGAWLYIQFRYWLPITLPVLALLTTHMGMVTYRAVFEQQERRRVKSLFAKLVSPEVVNELLQSEQLALGGGRRRVTAFFADVRGFTEMTDVSQAKAEDYVRDHGLRGESAEHIYDDQAREVLATVNLYLSTIADIIKKHDGTLDKYIGDCVMAFWGAPIPNEQHALCCVRAAIEAQQAIHLLNQQRQAENQRRLEENTARAAAGDSPLPALFVLSLGTGINTGLVTVGLMGSDATILNYTIFGREVNLASRLEGVSGRGRIIISESTFTEIQRDDPALAARCLEQKPVIVKGIRKPVNNYEVPWDTTQVNLPSTTT